MEMKEMTGTEMTFSAILKEYEGTDKLLEFCVGNTDRFLVGRVVRVYDAYYEPEDFDADAECGVEGSEIWDEEIEYKGSSVIVSIINPDGNDGGLAWFDCCDLVKIAVGTKNLKAKKLALKEEKERAIILPDAEGLDALLELSRIEQKMVAFESEDDSSMVSYAIVEAFGEDLIRLHEYTDWGEDDGTVFLNRDEIRICYYDGFDERCANKLRLQAE